MVTSVLKKEATVSSEALVTTYKTTWRHNQKDHAILRICCVVCLKFTIGSKTKYYGGQLMKEKRGEEKKCEGEM
jgi:hypothetical protein